jgi:hypothetical protein
VDRMDTGGSDSARAQRYKVGQQQQEGEASPAETRGRCVRSHLMDGRVRVQPHPTPPTHQSARRLIHLCDARPSADRAKGPSPAPRVVNLALLGDGGCHLDCMMPYVTATVIVFAAIAVYCTILW